MSVLALGDAPADIYQCLKQHAEVHRRSLNHEVIGQLHALRSLPANSADAAPQQRLLQVRAIAKHASSMTVFDSRLEVQIPVLGPDSVPKWGSFAAHTFRTRACALPRLGP
jgi:hypothetical protein